MRSFPSVLLSFAAWIAVAQSALPLTRSAAEEFLELNTDRDAFTPSTFVVDQGHVLTELSYVYIENREGKPTNSYPELLCRIGTTDWLELRFGVNYDVGAQGNVVTSVEAGEIDEPGIVAYESSVLYGLKTALADQDGILPQACFIVEGDTPMYGDRFGTVLIATAVAGWELPIQFPTRGAGPWRFDTALRYSYVEGPADWFSRWGPSAVLRLPLSDRVEAHAEWFGTFSEGLPEESSRPFFSPGMHFMITERAEIGLRVGWGLTNQAANFFSDLGCAFRY